MKRVYHTRSAGNEAGTKRRKSNLSPGPTTGKHNQSKKDNEDATKRTFMVKNDATNRDVKPQIKTKSIPKTKQQKCKNTQIFKHCKRTSDKLTSKKKNVVKTSSPAATSIDRQIPSEFTSEGSSIAVDKICDSKNEIAISPKPLYTELYTKEYANNDYKCIALDFLANVVCEINNTIWCGGQSMIHVYSKNGELLSIYTNEIQGVLDILKTSDGHVIVACANGLHHIELTADSQPGEYKALLTLGSFSGACFYRENLYAVEYVKRKIMVFNQKNKKWEHLSDIKINHSNRMPFHQLLIHNGLIYVSSFRDKYIHVYNLKGRFQHQRGKHSNKGNLCGIDQSGNLLLTEYGSNTNNGLAIYERGGCRNELKLFPEENHQWWPTQAAVDRDGNIWVACNYKKLFKFTQK